MLEVVRIRNKLIIIIIIIMTRRMQIHKNVRSYAEFRLRPELY